MMNGNQILVFGQCKVFADFVRIVYVSVLGLTHLHCIQIIRTRQKIGETVINTYT